MFQCCHMVVHWRLDATNTALCNKLAAHAQICVQLAPDGWSDAPLGLRDPALHASSLSVEEAAARDADIATVLSALSLYDLIKVVDTLAAGSSSSQRTAEVAAHALSRFASLGSDVARGDANAFICLESETYVAQLCTAMAAAAANGTTEWLTREIAALAAGALSQLATTKTGDRTCIEADTPAVQARLFQHCSAVSSSTGMSACTPGRNISAC